MTSVPPVPDGLTSRNFPVHWPVLTRWADNDMFGHLNNAVYYQLFDTAINGWIQAGVTLDPVAAPVQGIVAESGCRYFSELHFPERLVVGVAVTRLGNSSVTYLPTSRRPSRRSATGCMCTSTRPPAGRPRSLTTFARCCRPPA
jgi:acyl-CoA thioester hydrolase